MLHKCLQVPTLTPFLFAWKMLIVSFCSALRLNVSFKTTSFFHLPDSAFSFAAFVKTWGDLWPGICVELIKSLGGKVAPREDFGSFTLSWIKTGCPVYLEIMFPSAETRTSVGLLWVRSWVTVRKLGQVPPTPASGPHNRKAPTLKSNLEPSRCEVTGLPSLVKLPSIVLRKGEDFTTCLWPLR